MKFSAYKKDIADALKFVAKFAAVKPLSPILAGVRIDVNPAGMLKLTTTNLETAVDIIVPCSCDTEAIESCVVDAKFFQSVVGKISEDVFTVETVDKIFRIKAGSATFELPIFNAEEFPTVTQPDNFPIKIRGSVFKNMVNKVAFSSSKSDERPLFHGINLQLGNGELSAAATDMHRIAICRQAASAQGSFNSVIPNVAAINFADIIDGEDVDTVISIAVDDKKFAAKVNNVFFQTRLIEGEFPTYDRFIADERNTAHAEFDRNEFKEAINRVLLVARQNEASAVTVKIGDGKIQLSADGDFFGRVTDFVEADTTGEVEVMFNGNYFMDFLAAVDTQTVVGDFESAATTLLMEKNNPDFFYIVTPIRK